MGSGCDFDGAALSDECARLRSGLAKEREYVASLVDTAKRQAALIERAADAIVWCSGSDDFAPEGKAREGWKRVVRPVLADLLASAERVSSPWRPAP